MPDLALSDVTLHYEIGGDGPPLMLLAGMVSDSASWAPLIERLEARFAVIRPDNRTTGRTRPWDAPVSLAAMAGDAAALIEALGHGPAHVAGHSMGGLIAMELASARPDLVSRLTVMASAPMRMARNAFLFRTLLALRAEGMADDLWLRALFPWLFHPAAFDLPEQIEAGIRAGLDYPHAQSAEAMAQQVAALEAYDPAGLAPRVQVPTLALLAENDALIPEAEARAALAALPDVRIETVPRAGHSLHWDVPQAVAEALIRFSGVDGASASAR
ncbi:alpha/beta fold hydrolase [Rhodosalinus sp.]|uniref:alpha/beta fold hydrolase n=1 Tax=Rhodosalinus sp. TaxID=2047741 RepID=UPI00397E4A4F